MRIISVPSPNFTQGRKHYRPIAIVIHIMEGSLAATDSWFKAQVSQVSAHYGIGINGDVHQYVKETDTAWHAGRVNSPTWSLIKPAGNNLYINPNYYTIGIEHEGDENTIWSDATYNSSTTMIRQIAERWSIPLDRQHIIGHHEIYSLKACPGTKVDFNKLISMASGIPISNEPPIVEKIKSPGKATTHGRTNVRQAPATVSGIVGVVPANIQLAYDGYISDGEAVDGNSKWYYTDEGNWFWSGGVTTHHVTKNPKT